MCSAVCQQSHSRVPARTDQSRSVSGSSPLITHEITLSRSFAVTVMVLSSLTVLMYRARAVRQESYLSPADSSVLAELSFNLGLEDLADLRAGQVGPDLDLLGGLDAAESFLDEGAHLILRHGLAGAQLHDRGDPLAPFLVGQSDDRAVLHGRMGQQHLLDFGGVDVEAAGDDHVFGAVDDEQVIVVVEVADIPGVVPSVPGGFPGGLRVLVVARHDQRTAGDDLAALARAE